MDIVERLREGKFAGRYWREKEAAYEIGRLRELLQDREEQIACLRRACRSHRRRAGTRRP